MVTPAYDSGAPGSSASPSTPSSGPSSPAPSHSPAPAPARRPTITDVARAAGVSIAVVSYALNGRPGVSAATRERVLRVADEFGWRPSAAAQVDAHGAARHRSRVRPRRRRTGGAGHRRARVRHLAAGGAGDPQPRPGAPARRRPGGRRHAVRRVVGRAPVRRHGRHGRARGGSADRRAAPPAGPCGDRQCRSERCRPRLGDARRRRGVRPRGSLPARAGAPARRSGERPEGARAHPGALRGAHRSARRGQRRARPRGHRRAPPRRPRWRPGGC